MLFLVQAALAGALLATYPTRSIECKLQRREDSVVRQTTGTVQPSTLTDAGSVFTVYNMPNVDSYGRSVAKDGRLWIASYSDEIVGLSQRGDYVAYHLPRSQCGPDNLRATSDGFWFLEVWARNVAHLDLDGALSEVPVGDVEDVDADGTVDPTSRIEYAADGTRWSAAHFDGGVRWQKGAASRSFIVLFSGKSSVISSLLPDATGAWLAGYNADEIVHVAAGGTTDQVYATPHNCMPNSLTRSGGGVWFSCAGLAVIGRLSSDGKTTMIALPDADLPSSMVFGDGCALWVVEYKRVMRLITSPCTQN